MRIFLIRVGTVTFLGVVFVIGDIHSGILSAAERPTLDPRAQRRDPWAQARSQMVEYEVARTAAPSPSDFELAMQTLGGAAPDPTRGDVVL